MSNRLLIIYHYYEKDRTYIENFLHFLAFGYTPAADYVIVVAGACTIALPALDNIRYVYAENRNNDFGGYAHAMRTTIDPRAHDYFLFVNSSVRGPYMAPYSTADWSGHFVSMLAADADVGLVGSTINILSPDSPDSIAYQRKYGGTAPFSHVQTMCYAMPQAVLVFLCDSGFFEVNEVLEKTVVIRDYEIRLTQQVLERGWNIRCLLPEYNHTDYRHPHRDVNPTSAGGDANSRHGYFGRTAHPLEVMFIKVNRNLFSMEYLNRLSYSALQHRRPDPALAQHAAVRDYVTGLERVGNSATRVELTWRRHRLLSVIPRFLRPLAARYFPALLA